MFIHYSRCDPLSFFATPKMKIRFSRHAKRQMKWRKLSENDVLSAVKEPDDIENTIKGRKNAFKNFEKGVLRVTYKKDGDQVVIITALVKE